MNFQISGSLVLHLLKKYLIIAVLFGIVGGLVFTYANVRKSETTYVSSGELVQNDNNYNLIASYEQFVGSKRFTSLLDSKIDKSSWKNKQYSYDVELKSTGSRSTPFFNLQVTSKDKEFSRFVDNQAISLFNTNIGKYLSGANITLVSRASAPTVHGFQTKLVNWFMYGALVTFVVVSMLFTGKYLFLGKIKDERFIQDVFKTPSLGTIDTDDRKNR